MMLFKKYHAFALSIVWAQIACSSRFEDQKILSQSLRQTEFCSSGCLPVANSTKSFWIDSPNANPLATEGSGGTLTTDADVCIIGSGMTGVSTAHHLSELLERSSAPPLKAVIFEARDFCSGATGRNGGHLTPRAFLEFTTYAELYGEEEAMKSLTVEHHTASGIVDIIESHNLTVDLDLVEGGHITLFFTEESEREARMDYAAADAAGADLNDVEWMTQEQVSSKFGARYPGVKVPAHNLWPLKFVTGMYNITKLNSSKLSLHLHTRTPVTSMSPLESDPRDSLSRRWKLTTPRGSTSCTYVVHATNAYASHLLPQMRGDQGIVPTRGQIVAIRANASAEELTKASWSAEPGTEYWFPRPVNRTTEHPLVILGGGRHLTGPKRERYVTDDSALNPVISRALREYLPDVFPGKFDPDQEPEMEWSGIMGYTATGDPFVGPLGDGYGGQYVAAGFHGHGMPRAFACGEAVAQMIMSNLSGETWSPPDWLPRRYLTWEKT
ncbi:DAO-domain-containing protein [Gloeophyllum trabeum ATCC 11539]|uniref:DAO-domain-containing protein n=1 Tax=Gloeophyllum trabeum (strain ATCC 11539 / FP-39264 / Madison 617) TaxID=670483 RepID=S7RNV2_GLOTA|nr:DAO-domain-containing protein [Gloeophyllum trabeum ATCC 11539]EPQ56210.1 DAO-domain-containing protein [Gloeophyllum trabeum ATCC 11539]